MNSSTVKILIGAALFTAAYCPVNAFGPKPTAYPANKVTVTSAHSIRSTADTRAVHIGTPRAKVLALLGQPAQTVTPDVLLFEHCRPDQAIAQDCRILVVTFANDKVESLRFVNSPAAALIAENPTKSGNP